MSPSRPPLRWLAALGLLALAAACSDPARPDGGGTPPPPPAPPVVPDSLAFQVVPGGRLWLHGDARDSLGTPSDTLVRFAVADTTVATVDEKGQVTGRRPGRTIVVGEAAGRSVRLAVVVRTVRYRDVWPSAEGDGCALTTEGEALCWGGNTNGTLGGETLRSCAWLSPRLGWQCGSWPSDAPTFVRTRARFTTLAVGWGRRCGLTADGRAFCWGALATTVNGIVPCADTLPRGRCAYAPREEPAPLPWARLAVGAWLVNGTTCTLAAGGAPWCWGHDWSGNAGASGGASPTPAAVPTPTPVRAAPPLRDLAMGPVVTCGLDADDAVWCWGYSYYFGNDTTGVRGPEAVREPVRAANGMRFAAISMANGGCGLTRAGEAWCWWFGTRPAPAAPGHTFTSISAGEVSACGLTAEGEGWCWPYNRAPIPVTQGLRFRTLRVESYTACGIALDGRAWCIPYQANGENPPGAVGAPWILAGP